MQNSLRTAIGTLIGICLVAVVLVGCTQTGTPGIPGQDGMNNNTNAQTQGYGMDNAGDNRYGNTIGITGYNSRTNPGMNNAMNGTDGRTGPGTNLSAGPNMNYGNTGTQMSSADRQKADKIKRQIMNMPGVSSADVIVMGDTALCGVNTGTNTSLSQLRSSISQRVKQMDNTIRNVAVTNDSNILAEIQRLLGTNPQNVTGNTVTGNNRMNTGTNNGMNTGMNNGARNRTNTGANNRTNNPVTNLMDQFNDLVRRATTVTR